MPVFVVREGGSFCYRFEPDASVCSGMPPTPTVFTQITSRIFPAEFARCVSRFPMPRSSRSFSAFDHFLALCFGHLTGRESLRDVVTCLTARPELQYRLGFRGRITRTNFAYAN